jgi:hypothetical protein
VHRSFSDPTPPGLPATFLRAWRRSAATLHATTPILCAGRFHLAGNDRLPALVHLNVLRDDHLLAPGSQAIQRHIPRQTKSNAKVWLFGGVSLLS